MRISLLTAFCQLVLFAGFTEKIAAQELPVYDYFPESRLFEAIYLDPNEAQTGGALNAYWENNQLQEKVYIPLSIGFYKPFLRINKKRTVEIGIDFSAHFQFEWLYVNEKFQRNLLNTDYRFSLITAIALSDNQRLRIRGYHVSSHLGDDYILNNKIRSRFPNKNNYEQLDVTWLRENENFKTYAMAGLVVRPVTDRKRLVFQFGGMYDKRLSSTLPLGLVGGLNIKLLQENNFNPGVKAGFGIRMGAVQRRPAYLIAEFYRGNSPYGPYEYRKEQWLGAGLYFSPF